MASPSEMIGWECGACTYTNDDCTRRDCQMCMTEGPKRYVVVPGVGVSATARTTTVDRREQARLAALHDAVHDAPPPVDEEPIAEGVPVVPVQGAVTAVPSRRIMLERLVGTLVDVVGTTANNRGRSCRRHSCCGSQVVERSTVAFRREQLVFRDQREEDVIAVYLISHGVITCKVGFLPAHLNHRARDYNGLVARVVSVYSDCCTNLVKRQKFRRNHGCSAAKIVWEHMVV
jgi:hypothetical protein